jgi:hypothetical protein
MIKKMGYISTSHLFRYQLKLYIMYRLLDTRTRTSPTPHRCRANQLH